MVCLLAGEAETRPVKLRASEPTSWFNYLHNGGSAAPLSTLMCVRNGPKPSHAGIEVPPRGHYATTCTVHLLVADDHGRWAGALIRLVSRGLTTDCLVGKRAVDFLGNSGFVAWIAKCPRASNRSSPSRLLQISPEQHEPCPATHSAARRPAGARDCSVCAKGPHFYIWPLAIEA
jgi:hypothetical protein